MSCGLTHKGCSWHFYSAHCSCFGSHDILAYLFRKSFYNEMKIKNAQARWYYQNRFYSRPWDLSQIRRLQTATLWERRRDQRRWGQRQHKTKKTKIGIYRFYVIIQQQLTADFIFFVHFEYVARNKSELQKFWEVQMLQGLSDIAKIESKLVLLVETKNITHLNAV